MRASPHNLRSVALRLLPGLAQVLSLLVALNFGLISPGGCIAQCVSLPGWAAAQSGVPLSGRRDADEPGAPTMPAAAPVPALYAMILAPVPAVSRATAARPLPPAPPASAPQWREAPLPPPPQA